MSLDNIGFALIVIGLLVIWGRVVSILQKVQKQKDRSASDPVWRSTNRDGIRSSNNSQTEVHMNPISALVFIIFIGGAVLARLANMPIAVTVVLALIGIFLGYSIKMAQQWERAVILRLGKLHAVKGPGLFILVPIIDAVATWIDQRIRTTEVNAEQALTKDTVPVNVDAIVFWMVHDAERAALEIADYISAVQRVAQTSLREMIGSSVLSELLSDRKTADAALKEVIGA